ncbi:MAG TPA: alpha/beta fold hydrolase [Rhodospirillales bacterium]|nr:alpha/beta fold hydrolase [Rhodospirillales bacterium]
MLTFVFVHGFLGFNRLSFPLSAVHYFRGLEVVLRRLGAPYLIPILPAAGTVEERAESLAAQIQNAAGSFVLVGHSMGGLDSRYAASHLDPDHRVRAVITLGTPHRGAPLADWMLSADGSIPNFFRRRYSRPLTELTPTACLVRNETMLDREDVYYASYAGRRATSELPRILRFFAPHAGFIEGDETDGMVPVSSAKWGEFQGTAKADHLELVGWSLGLPSKSKKRPFLHLPLYRSIIADIQDRLL